ncbi:19803_t:CDS:1, partial [Racocetra persica]
HAAEISNWIDQTSETHHYLHYDVSEIPYEFKLLHRGSRDGFEFDRPYMGYWAGKLIVSKVSKTNEIIGGFIPLENRMVKTGTDRWKTNYSFIFSLKNEIQKESILSRVNNVECAIIVNNTLLSFGGSDLRID